MSLPTTKPPVNTARRVFDSVLGKWIDIAHDCGVCGAKQAACYYEADDKRWYCGSCWIEWKTPR